jgi:transposase
MGYPLKMREHVFKIKKEKGLSFRQLSEQVNIGIATLLRWAKRIEPKNKRNRPCLKIPLKELKKDIEKYGDAYHWERAVRFGVSTSAIYYAMKKMGVTYKKNPLSTRRQALLPEKGLRQR